jgi:HPt (histidine-containing phosphotransfer) domain-containing protein
VEEVIWQVFNKYMGLTNPLTKEKKTETVPATSDVKYDLERLINIYQNDQEFINELLIMTKHGVENNLFELKKHVDQGNLAGVQAIGHKLKGAASAVFLTQITAIANTLEHLTHFDPIYIRTLLSELENESNDLALFLKNNKIDI